MTGRALLVLCLAVLGATSARAQESVFNLPGLGIPGTGESIRARGMGGGGLGLESEAFSLEAPAQLARFVRTGIQLSALGHRASVDDGTRSADVEGFTFPMGQLVVPAWRGSALAVGFYQFADFDASVGTTLEFAGDTLPVSVRSEGGISVLSPAFALPLDERTALGVSLDVYLGSRRILRQIGTLEESPGALATVDSLERDFRAVGLTLNVERRVGDLLVSAAWRWRPTIESRVTAAPSPAMIGRKADFELGSELSLGASTRLDRRVLAAAAIRWADWSGIEDDDGATFGSALDIGGGIEVTPARRRLLVFDSDAPFRAGLRWRRHPLRVGGEPLEEWSASLGYGRSFLGTWSRFDAALELGRRGDVDTVGVSESFARLGVAISVFEQWRRGGPQR